MASRKTPKRQPLKDLYVIWPHSGGNGSPWYSCARAMTMDRDGSVEPEHMHGCVTPTKLIPEAEAGRIQAELYRNAEEYRQSMQDLTEKHRARAQAIVLGTADAS